MTWRIGIAESTLASGRTGVSIGNTSTGFRTWQGPECNLGKCQTYSGQGPDYSYSRDLGLGLPICRHALGSNKNRQDA